MRGEIIDVVNDVYDPLGSRVEDHHVRADHPTMIDGRQAGQLPLQVLREGFKPLLQSRRQSSVTLKLLLQARGQIAIALCQPWWKIGIAVSKINADEIAIMPAEDDCGSAVSFSSLILVFAISIALPQAGCRYPCNENRYPNDGWKDRFQHDRLRVKILSVKWEQSIYWSVI